MPSIQEILDRLISSRSFLRDFQALPADKQAGAAGRNLVLREAKNQFGINVELPVEDREELQEDLLAYLRTGTRPEANPSFYANPAPTLRKETPVKFFETVSYVNGYDIRDMTAQQVVSAIAAKEAEVENLKKVKAQPKVVVRAIAKIEADIAGLVALLDSQEPTTPDAPTA